MEKTRINQGKLIILEGPNGVGKTTISQQIAQYFNDKGLPYELMSFPGKEPGTISKVLYELLHDPSKYDVKSLTPTSKQMLHIAAHLDAIERHILPILRSGRNMMLDRFWWSTWVYGLVSGINPRVLKSMIALERAQWQDVKPECVILIRRHEPIEREVIIEDWQKLTNEYERLAIEEKSYPVFTIDNADPLKIVIENIKEILDRKHKKYRKERIIEQSSNNNQLTLELGNYREPSKLTPLIVSHILPAKPTVVYDTYWRFAAERQKIFFKKIDNAPLPWTVDPILSTYKFTNAYRASDRTSQYLIRNVIYRNNFPNTPNEVFFRIILFKIFNKIQTWELLQDKIGPLMYADYSFEEYDRVLTEAMQLGQSIYSAAYIMPSGGKAFGEPTKHRTHLKLIEQMMANDLPKRLADAKNMQQGFDLLRNYPTIGDFLAYQFITDVNYSEITNFSEMEFVIPGPGALDGIRKCFTDLGGLNEPEIIKFMAENQESEFDRLGLKFNSLWGRPLQLIDCQNLFCEVDKYARMKHPDISGISGRTRIKQRYSAKIEPIDYWYPPKWKINQAIEESRKLSLIKT